jgi:hypothetical protein
VRNHAYDARAALSGTGACFSGKAKNMTPAAFQAYIERRKGAQQFRALHPAEALPKGHVRRDGETLINFSSNDYLGLRASIRY